MTKLLFKGKPYVRSCGDANNFVTESMIGVMERSSDPDKSKRHVFAYTARKGEWKATNKFQISILSSAMVCVYCSSPEPLDQAFEKCKPGNCEDKEFKMLALAVA